MESDGIVRDEPMDAADWEYTLGGKLIGTDWELPEEGVDTIGKLRQSTERHEGQEMTFPEIVFRYTGKRVSVSGFLRRIDPNDVGDVEPADSVADRIVSVQKEDSWRKQ